MTTASSAPTCRRARGGVAGRADDWVRQPTASPSRRFLRCSAPARRPEHAYDDPRVSRGGSCGQVLGDAIFLRLHPDWKVGQAEGVRSACTNEERDVFVAVSDEQPVGFVAVALNAFHERMGVIETSASIPTTNDGVSVPNSPCAGDLRGSRIHAPAERAVLRSSTEGSWLSSSEWLLGRNERFNAHGLSRSSRGEIERVRV